MNISVPLKIDKAAFFDFIQRQDEGRFEYERGRIVQQMTGGTRGHSEIAQRFIDVLRRALDPAKWLVTGHSRGVETEDTVRYPDVLVEPARETWDDLATTEPVLVIEVLSASSEKRDLNVKPAEYTTLASLSAYIVAHQDKPECLVWIRDAGGAFAGEPRRIEGRDGHIEIAALGVRISLAEVYRGIRSA